MCDPGPPRTTVSAGLDTEKSSMLLSQSSQWDPTDEIWNEGSKGRACDLLRVRDTVTVTGVEPRSSHSKNPVLLLLQDHAAFQHPRIQKPVSVTPYHLKNTTSINIQE